MLELNCTIKWLEVILVIFWSCFLIAIVGIFILQPNSVIPAFGKLLFTTLQPNTVSSCLIPREQNEWAQCYSCDEKALSSRPPWSGLKIKVYEILSQQRDIWGIVLCFDVILSFSVTTQITAAKQTRLVIHSSKRKGGTLCKWSLELLTGFSATAVCYFLGKTRKTVKCTGQKKTPKNRHHCWQKPKTKD